MIGFLIGTLCLFGLIKMLRPRPWWSRGGDCHAGYGEGGGGCSSYRGDGSSDGETHKYGGGWGGWGRRGPRGFGRFWSRLGTNSEQDEVIREVMDQVRHRGQDLRSEVKASKSRLARLFQEESITPEELEREFAQSEVSIQAMRTSVLEGMTKIHAVLNPEQRRRLAEFLDKRSTSWNDFEQGPYRSGVSLLDR
jgi:Spy/CpxP family protein refolding chaperone